MKVMSKIRTLRIIKVFSLQFVQKMCPSCKINMYVFFFHMSSLSSVYSRDGCVSVCVCVCVWMMMASGVVPLTLAGYWKIMSLQRIDGD